MCIRDRFCQDKCVNSEDYVRYRAKNVRGYDSVEAVKLDILNNGPVETWFAVYDDFFNYESGIYSPDSDFLMGYNAVEVIGGGVEDNVLFFFQAEDGIRDRSPSRGLGDVYKRQYQKGS
eukprot:TRINITY_DN30297_c0_g1_i1.p1 TRINITY_DN30297_c0_g1~~TRINITY_DN30297_c0_g1_i1.p1  ORF type:complete len:133 (+),score=62.80 TRINITY_DN30297_c0_g1_i1:43-399(+)